ncbi:MAG: shikimate kinase [Burkholderiaceae bacterium]|jgi:shikimate kinase
MNSPPLWPNTSNIVLIGLMGAGKTTIGRKLALRLGREFVDTDHEIEARSGASVATIFELEGEEGFRRREAKMLLQVMQLEKQVVTTGGGAPIRPENRPVIAKGFVIYLEADPRQLWQRLRMDQSRPLLSQSSDPKATLEKLHAERDPIYRQLANCIVTSTRGSMGQVLAQIEQELRRARLVGLEQTMIADSGRDSAFD